MPVIEGTSRFKTAMAEYDFTKDGGTVGAKTLRAVDVNGGTLPAGSVVVGGYVDVLTAATSAASTATIALHVEGAGDLVAAAAVSGAPFSTTGRKDIVPDSTGSTAVKTTVARAITATVAVQALTAGKFRVVLFYV
jgi:hypothetical protein